MRKTKLLFLVICLILFIIFIWNRTETVGDGGGYSIYHMENAVTKSGKVIPLGWNFHAPAGDPVVSFKITVEGRTEKAGVILIDLAAVNEVE